MELERGRKAWRLPVRGGVVTNDGLLCGPMAKLGLGLAYVPEPLFADEIRRGLLTVVLDAYAPSVPGYFIYYPSRAQRSTPLRLFIEVAKEVMSGSSTSLRLRPQNQTRRFFGVTSTWAGPPTAST